MQEIEVSFHAHELWGKLEDRYESIAGLSMGFGRSLACLHSLALSNQSLYSSDGISSFLSICVSYLKLYLNIQPPLLPCSLSLRVYPLHIN